MRRSPKPRPLTAKQAEIDRLIRAHYATFGEGPSIALLQRRLKVGKTALRSHLAALVSKGRLVSVYSPLTPRLSEHERQFGGGQFRP
ncbi:MAG TPA: hypothetical protein VF406_16145 [Thermodesulfobacteriota bacterium]